MKTNCTKNVLIYCIKGSICPRLFSPSSPSLSAGEYESYLSNMSYLSILNTSVSGRIQDKPKCLEEKKGEHYTERKHSSIQYSLITFSFSKFTDIPFSQKGKIMRNHSLIYIHCNICNKGI